MATSSLRTTVRLLSVAAFFSTASSWRPDNTSLATSLTGRPVVSFTVDGGAFCSLMVGNEWAFVDSLLSLAYVGRDDARCASDSSLVVTHAFSEWERNSDLAVAWGDVGKGGIVVRTGALSEGVLAHTRRDEIVVTDRSCWIPNRDFCARARENIVPLSVFSGLLAFCAAVIGMTRAAREARCRVSLVAVVLAVALFFAASVFPCYVCSDLFLVVMHEVGHAIGIGHPDAGPGEARFGCGANATAGYSDERGSVMRSTLSGVPVSLCLTREDVDAAKTLWGGDCTAPVTCTLPFAGPLGFHRVVVAYVYALVVGGALSFLPRCCSSMRKSARRRRVST